MSNADGSGRAPARGRRSPRACRGHQQQTRRRASLVTGAGVRSRGVQQSQQPVGHSPMLKVADSLRTGITCRNPKQVTEPVSRRVCAHPSLATLDDGSPCVLGNWGVGRGAPPPQSWTTRAAPPAPAARNWRSAKRSVSVPPVKQRRRRPRVAGRRRQITRSCKLEPAQNSGTHVAQTPTPETHTEGADGIQPPGASVHEVSVSAGHSSVSVGHGRQGLPGRPPVRLRL